MSLGRVAIIGGGLGGLALALRLSRHAAQVSVCEAASSLGGKMNCWTQGGYRFDTGPSLLTMPWVFSELYAAAGEDLREHLELVPVRTPVHYVFADGTHLDLSSSLPELLGTVREHAPEDAAGLFRFLTLGARLYEMSRHSFFRRSPAQPPDRRSLKALIHAPLRYGWGNYHRTVEAFFSSPYLRQIYDRFATYVGSSPYHLPATLALIPYLEHAFGGYFIRGGLYRLVESLVDLCTRSGVAFEVACPVERITTSGRAVTGVVLANGRKIPAAVVVMNGDASTTGRLLGEKDWLPLPEADRSLSGLVLLIGLSHPLPAQPHHAVYFSRDYGQEFSQLFGQRVFPDDPTVYVCVPSRADRSVAPPNGETLFIMANAPATDGNGWAESELAVARQRIFRRLEQGGFPTWGADVAVSKIITPRLLAEQYLMPGGAIYGTNSHGWRRAFFRPPNRDRRWHGLYYVGGSTHPGGGTPTVLLSAQITEQLILEGT